MIGRTVSHYRIISPLGSGGMGVVYLAEDARLGRQVALKFLPASWSNEAKALERFRVEARAASSLSHPAICAIYDIGQDGDTPFIVMEALKGETLRDRIIKGPLKVAEVLDIGIQLADALDAAHAQGIVHRDIKPANIFLGDRNRVKVLDFGLAKLTGSPSSLSSGADTMSPGDRTKGNQITQPGTALGTVSYMSPEQARGEPIDSRTDLFSLGAVMYEMVTGVQAFGGSTTAVVYDAILNRAPRPIAHLNPLIPPRLEVVIATALEKDRELRYQHASDLQAELRRIRRDMDSLVAVGSQTAVMPVVASVPAERMSGVDQPKPRAGWPQGIAIVMAALAIVFAVALFWRGQVSSGDRAAASASDVPTISSAQPTGTPVTPPPVETTPAPAGPESQAASEPVEPAAPPPQARPAAPPELSPSARGSRPTPATPANPGRAGDAGTATPRTPAATPSPTPRPDTPPVPGGVREQPAPAPTPVQPAPAPSQPAPSQTAPSQPLPSQPAPSQTAPSQPLPSQPAPSQTAPSQPTPAKPAPSEPAPSQPAPTPPAPSQPAPSQPAPSQPAPSQPAPVQPAPTPPRATAPTPTPPTATPVESDDAAIRRVIRTYEQAIETKDIALYRSVRKNLTPADENVLTNSFRQIDSQQIDIRVENLRITGRTATARLARRDTLTIGGRRDVRNSTQTMQFEKTDAGWQIAE